MNRIVYLLALVVIIINSCSDDTTTPVGDIDEQLILDYIEEKKLDAVPDTTRGTGIYHIIQHKGLGNEFPTFSSKVKVNYTGYLTNDTVFDSGTLDMVLSGTVRGFQYGVTLLRRGGKAKIIIPSSLGYGATTITNSDNEVVVPANSILIFDIELEDFE